MGKSIYCVKHEWFDEHGKRLSSRTCTHTWFGGITAARNEFEKRCEYLYSHISDRKVVRNLPTRDGWSAEDGSYELSAAEVHAHGSDVNCIRIALCAVDLH